MADKPTRRGILLGGAASAIAAPAFGKDVSREKLERFHALLAEYKRRQAKKEQSQRGWYDEDGVRQGGVIAFVRYFWRVLEPVADLVEGWPLWAMCEHLEAVSFGEITRLLINVPPGFMKSMLVDIFWPAWEWGALNKPDYRYVAFSYSAGLTERDNQKFRDLISSADYQMLYGDRVKLRNKTIIRVMNTGTGWKLASSVGGLGTGERGDRVIIDDPHNVIEGESEVIRTETVRWFRESISSRFNRLDAGALIVIMQRVHEEDVSGTILQLKQEGLDYCHLMIPWEFDPSRSILNEIGWLDPRHDEDNVDLNAGEPAWVERFSVASMRQLRIATNTYAWAAQYQQLPSPRGGGIFQRDWWQTWESPDNKFPPFEYIIASLDSAFTAKEENDPSGFTVWGVFRDAEKHRRIMLVHAWRKHLEFSADRKKLEPLIGEDDKQRYMFIGDKWATNPQYQRWRRRTMEHWGLMEWVNDSCNRFKVDKLLIEAKASGISAAQELQNRWGSQDWSVQLYPTKGDKIARAYAVQPTFSQQMVYAPVLDWAEMVIDEAAVFPKGKHDDLTDSMTQAIKYLRDIGLAQTDDEAFAAEMERVTHKSGNRAMPLYPV